ncbi:MAG: threonine/serine exporter family protein, partial [Hungatella sp.]
LLSRLFAVRKRCPVTIFLIPGIFSLVPGAGLYWTSYYIVTNDVELAAQTGFTALKVAVAIVLGIVFVFQLPQRIFRVGMKKDKRG